MARTKKVVQTAEHGPVELHDEALDSANGGIIAVLIGLKTPTQTNVMGNFIGTNTNGG